MKGIKEKIVFVTGGEKGLGKAVAQRFVEEGATVVIYGIDEESGKATELELQEKNSASMFIKGNVLNNADLASAMKVIKEKYGRLDFAINCAGSGNGLKLTHEQTVEEYDFVMDLNVKGVFFSMQHELKLMLEEKEGRIVNVSSSLGLVGMKNLSVYTASKHAVVGFTRAAALDYADTDIRINAVAPGTMMTPMVATFPEEVVANLKAAHPFNSLVSVERTAGNIVFLCSEDSSDTTGAVIAIDGGLTAQ